MAVTQTSRSSSCDDHMDSAKYTASWVLPHEPGQSGEPGVTAAERAGVSATLAPGVSICPRPGADSGLATKPAASGGTRPDLTGQVTVLPVPPAGSAGARLSALTRYLSCSGDLAAWTLLAITCFAGS